MENNNALTAQDVADLLKIAKNTVYEMIKRDEINSYRVGRKVRFTMEDVESYISQAKNIKIEEDPMHFPHKNSVDVSHSEKGFVICGQDIMLDILSNYMNNPRKNINVLRSYTGSYDSLVSLYHGDINAAAVHLWDGDTGDYNVPYVRRLLPGIPAVIIHLTYRMQGFYVAKGNPKGIKGWEDLKRPDITMINREKGAGSRVLLDEHLRLLGIYGSSIKGYKRESRSHITVAGTVARGGADLALGHEKIARQVNGIDFIPLQNERYDLVVRKEDFYNSNIQNVLEILQSKEFQEEFENIGGYDVREMGKILAET